MELTEIIVERIRREGPLSFHDFMEMCLYEPEAGYYSASNNQIGEAGDFYTSPHYSSLFGRLIAKQLEEMWELMERKPFTILEYGAGPGTLCLELLQSLGKNETLYRDLRYCIIEKSASMRKRERSALPGKVSWHERIEDIPDLNGCILSNELVDNFPVHAVVQNGELMEVYVDWQNGFTELLRPASAALKDYFSELQITLPAGFRTEVNLDATRWIRDIAQGLKRGFVITIDYGFPSAGLYSEQRRNGTLMCYHRHTRNDNPYQDVGKQDITAHVNFSALAHWGAAHGLQCSGFTHQSHFLQALGLGSHLKKTEAENPGAAEREKENMLSTFLMDLGVRLKVLVQQKGIFPGGLSGLQFGRRFV